MYEKRPGPFTPDEFTEAFWTTLTDAIVKAQEGIKRPVAAFDADGTLWDCDIGEGFFNFEIQNCPLRNMPVDPWRHYDEWKSRDPRAAYLWLAQINAGFPYSQVQKWAAEAVEKREGGLPIFASQKKLVQFLQDRGFEIYVVTASVRWAVVPAAARLGIPDDHVLGIETEIVDGIVTDRQHGPLTWREGKPEAILKATGDQPPLFCSGNTTGDTALLELASHVRLAVSSRSNAGDLERTEIALQDLAKNNGWFSHRF